MARFQYPLDHDQVLMLARETAELLEELVAADGELRRQASSASDPRRSSGNVGGGNGGGPSIRTEDEHGDTDTVSATATEAFVMNGEKRRQDLQDAHRRVWSSLDSARDALTGAWNHYERLTRGPERLGSVLLDDAPKPVNIDEIWCTSCLRIGELNPRGKPKDVGQDSTLCAWCHAFARDTGGALPHPLLLRRKVEKNGRLTDRDYREVTLLIRRERRGSKKRSKKR